MAKQHIKGTNPFAQDEPSPLEQKAAELYDFGGPLGVKQDTGKQTARLTSIFEIYPDPAQPRRALPSAVRALWDGKPESLVAVFTRWMALVEQERGAALDAGAFIEADGDKLPNVSSPGPLEGALVEVLMLAGSIRRDGLTNPVTVAKTEHGYQLETGERRWLAYHVLFAFFNGDEKWSKIPARVVPAVSVWRQAAENAARQDLNAIGKARQYAMLLMELWKAEGKEFQPLSAFADEQEYYAQARDMGVPYGRNDVLLTSMGFKNRSALNRHKALLGLPPDVWQRADDYNCPESVLRGSEKMSPEQVRAQFELWLLMRGEDVIVASGNDSGDEIVANGNDSTGQIVASGNDSDNPTIPTRTQHPPALSPELAALRKFEGEIARWRKQVTRLRAVGQGGDSQISQIKRLLREFLDELDSPSE